MAIIKNYIQTQLQLQPAILNKKLFVILQKLERFLFYFFFFNNTLLVFISNKINKTLSIERKTLFYVCTIQFKQKILIFYSNLIENTI